jgi:hypothetical protein
MNTCNPFGRSRKALNTSTITIDQKEWLGRDVFEGKHSGAYWDARYQLPKNTVKTWANTLKEHGVILPQGRPPRLSTKEINLLHESIDKSNFDMSKKSFDDLADDLARKRAENDLKRPLPSTYSLPKTNRRELDKVMNLSDKNAERHTQARAASESDVRNLVSFAAANHWMINNVNKNLYINADATQFQVGGSLKQNKRVKAYKGRNSNLHPYKVLPSKDENLTCFFIKYYAMISLEGFLADPIFIIADESMEKDVIDCYSITGLGIGTDPANKGYLVFCKDRCLCNDYYEWILRVCLIDFIKKIKTSHNLKDGDLSWFTVDGETKQLNPFSSPDTIKFLQDNSIEVGKPPGSLTRLSQPCDAWVFFKSIKTTLRHLCFHAQNSDLRSKLVNSFLQHEQKIGSMMKPKHKQMAIEGLMDIQASMNKAITPAIIRQSFQETGMYDDTTGSYDLSKMIEKFNLNVDPEITLKISSAIPKLSKIIGNSGELTEQDMTNAGIPETSSKDQYIVGRRRYITLTNRVHVENERKKAAASSKPRGKSLNQPSQSSKAVIQAPADIGVSKRIRKKRIYEEFYEDDDNFED